MTADGGVRVAALERRLEAFRQVLVTLLPPEELERAARLLEATLSVSAQQSRRLLGLPPVNAKGRPAADAGPGPPGRRRGLTIVPRPQPGSARGRVPVPAPPPTGLAAPPTSGGAAGRGRSRVTGVPADQFPFGVAAGAVGAALAAPSAAFWRLALRRSRIIRVSWYMSS